MSTTTQRPTPETDALHAKQGLTHASYRDFARKLERERDEAREELQAMRDERNQLSRDLSSLLAADCLNGHDAVEGVRNGIAMREAIKEAHRFIRDIVKNHECGDDIDASGEAALAKLQPFLP